MRIENAPIVDEQTVRNHAEAYTFGLDEETVAAFAQEFAGQNDLLTNLERYAENEAPVRDYHWATDDEDPLGGFLTKTNVSTTDEGPIAGLELAIKDNIAVAGVPMTCGSKVMESYVPTEDATVVSRLLDAGGTIVGKANMDEFAFGGDKSTLPYRLARNPRNPEHQPGGSSVGSGVAVANGDVDEALGTDTGGSVRFPASWCGVVGIKPTRGLVSLDGFGQFSKTLDTIGPLARETETAAKVLQAMAGSDPADEQTHSAIVGEYVKSVEAGRDTDLSDLTVGVVENLMGKHEDIDAHAWEAIDQLEAHGAEVVSIDIPSYEDVVPAWLGVGFTEIGAYMRARGQNYWLDMATRPSFVAALDEGLRTRAEELGPTVRSTLVYAEYLTSQLGDEYYALASRARRQLTAEVNELFEEVDVFASTGVPALAPKWGEGDELDVLTAMSNTAPFNLTGHPAACLPSGRVDGLPTSLQLVAPLFDEETLFRVASTWETISDEDWV